MADGPLRVALVTALEGLAARRFVVLEDWLNDGVPLAAPVAREVLSGWYGANTPAAGAWRLARRPAASTPAPTPPRRAPTCLGSFFRPASRGEG